MQSPSSILLKLRGQSTVDLPAHGSPLSLPRMKLLVFAHVPPPHHGQSAMVKQMLDGLGSGRFGDFEIHHVDARFSRSMEDVGRSGVRKLLLALWFAGRAIILRFRHGIDTFYYVPAPPKVAAITRDWLVLALCRPFFRKIIFHWHAVGLGLWTVDQRPKKAKPRVFARLTQAVLRGHHRSIVLSQWARQDVENFSPKDVRVVPNGIPDPFPNFEHDLLPHRLQRQEQLRAALRPDGPKDTFQLLFLGHCTAAKGLWDLLQATAIAATRLQERHLPLQLKLAVAGEFPDPSDRVRFEQLCDSLASQHHLADDWVMHHGFVAGDRKRALLQMADCLCFPTRYEAESFGLVIIEALAAGIPAIASDWRMVPEIMDAAALPVFETGNPSSLAEAILAAPGRDDPAALRAVFLRQFTADAMLQRLATAVSES
jgi:glycosyltransferase involved in cell wall biosynthesis